MSALFLLASCASLLALGLAFYLCWLVTRPNSYWERRRPVAMSPWAEALERLGEK